MRHLQHSLLSACLVAASLGCYAQAQENKSNDADRFFTQVPEVMPAVTANAVESPSKPSDDFDKCPTTQWIWGDEANRKYVLRQSFDVKDLKSAKLRGTCDNSFTLKINGKVVGSSSTWENPIQKDVKSFLQNGKNELVAEVTNQGGASGCCVQLVWTDGSNARHYVVSDASWTAKELDKEQPENKVRVVGKLGDKPWGDVFDRIEGDGVPNQSFVTLPGFQVEQLFTVPKEKLGSWVAMTIDSKGRIIAADQSKEGFCRITPPAVGSKEPTKVERLPIVRRGTPFALTNAQGLLFAFDSLYICVNGSPRSGLYRARDTDNDDQWDEVELLHDFHGAGEHGPHALRLSPDGKHVVVICGNHTLPPFSNEEAKKNPDYRSRIPTNWSEDLLLPRQWDANGHAVGILAPGGWIAQTDPDGKTWEVLSMGYRNPYDMAYNEEGELFAYDADMEWDLGAPWYRPTRVVHATSGSEFGWRSGTGKWPTYYPDSLPPAIDIGPGSPVGVEFGRGAKFPAKYQRALFICDWTFGTMYAIHLTPEGSTYRGEKEEFLSRTPLPLTDLAVSPDGAMYFTVGGRGTQSELFRVTYVGNESTAPVSSAPATDALAALRKARREIERWHAVSLNEIQAATNQDIEKLIRAMGHEDRFIRYAARVALERFPVDRWMPQTLESKDAKTVIAGVIGLARQATEKDRSALLTALQKLPFDSLTESDQLAWCRALQLVCIRLNGVDEKERLALLNRLDPLFPVTASSAAKPASNAAWVYAADLSHQDALNRELINLLVYLKSEQVVHRAIPLLEKSSDGGGGDLGGLLARNRNYGGAVAGMMKNQPDLQQVHYVFALRNAKTGWTLPERKAYFSWFERAQKWSGGASFQKFLINISNDAFENSPEADRLAIEASGARKPYEAPELPKPEGPGQAWTVESLVAASESNKVNREIQRGEKSYAAARCLICHRFAGKGGATGPDLTQVAGRFSFKDLADSIVNPSKVISDQYRAVQIVTADGKVVIGRLLSENDREVTLLVDPESSSKQVTIARKDIESMEPSKVSLMPADLLNSLNENEVLDLMHYLLSRGKK